MEWVMHLPLRKMGAIRNVCQIRMTDRKIKLLGKSPEELKHIVEELGLPKFTANQIADWVYHKKVREIDQMTNLSKSARERLSSKYCVGVTDYVHRLVSVDGTKKYLFPVMDGVPGGHTEKSHSESEGSVNAGLDLNSGLDVEPVSAADPVSVEDLKSSVASVSAADSATEFVEAVMIPDGERSTLCVSSQAGCKMGCKFCMTGRQGFHGNLSVAEILSQFYSVDESDVLTNAVFMGMGEPLDNYDSLMRVIDVLTSSWGFAWSPKRITVSTIGVLPRLKDFLDNTRCHIAVSLHNPFPDERLTIMPVQKAWSITEVVHLLDKYDFSGQRRVSFEYTMFDGFNDSPRHAEALARLLRNLECRVNLIRFHQIPDFPYRCAPRERMLAFQKIMNDAGITTTIRASKGEDILAACGLLAGEHRDGR